MQQCKGTFFSESTDVFVITLNRRTFIFPETENLNFGVFLGCLSQPKAAFLLLKVSKLSKFTTISISKQFSVTKTQLFSFREKNVCLFGVMTKTSLLSEKNVPLQKL